MRRRGTDTGIRERYLTDLRYLAAHYGGAEFGYPWARRIADLEAGRAVTVQHAYQLDLHPRTPGPFRLDANGTVTSLAEDDELVLDMHAGSATP